MFQRLIQRNRFYWQVKNPIIHTIYFTGWIYERGNLSLKLCAVIYKFYTKKNSRKYGNWLLLTIQKSTMDRPVYRDTQLRSSSSKNVSTGTRRNWKSSNRRTYTKLFLTVFGGLNNKYDQYFLLLTHILSLPSFSSGYRSNWSEEIWQKKKCLYLPIH